MLALQALYYSYSNSICPSLRLSVCLSHAGIVKTTARSTVQFALSDSKMRLVFYKPKKLFQRNDPFTLKSWLRVNHPLLKAVTFDTFCIVAPQW